MMSYNHTIIQISTAGLVPSLALLFLNQLKNQVAHWLDTGVVQPYWSNDSTNLLTYD